LPIPAQLEAIFNSLDMKKIRVGFGSGCLNDTWIFHSSLLKWVAINCIGDIPSCRSDHAAAVLYGVMYVFGGRSTEEMGGNMKIHEDLHAFYPEGRSSSSRF